MKSIYINKSRQEMCEYTIRQYWSEKTNNATLEPGWLTSGEKLTEEQQEIKDIYDKTIKSNIKYQRLSKEKPEEEEIGDFYIKYSYLDKRHPGNYDGNVTDITMCINKKKDQIDHGNEDRKLNKIAYVGIILMVVMVMFFFANSISTNTGIEVTSQEETLAKESDIPPLIPKKKELSKSERLKKEICRREELNVKNPEECWQYYVYDKCRDKADTAYQRWLKKTTVPECTGVNSYPWESTPTKKRWDDFSNKIKQDEPMKQNIEQFFTGGVKDE